MPDGRILAIECKVSNSKVNSFKRLNNDAAVKARAWVREFGERNIIPVAVLGGVFNPKNVIEAQRDIYLFWEHRLDELCQFLAQST